MNLNQQRKQAILSRLRNVQTTSSPTELRENAKPVVIRDSKDFFIAQLKKAQCSVAMLSGKVNLPQIVADYLKEEQLPLQLRIAEQSTLLSLPWNQFGIEISFPERNRLEQQVFIHADYGIAETGTLVCLPSSTDTVTSRFLCDVQIVLINESHLLRYYEEFWFTFRQKRSTDEAMPRVINWITGPSRTADIEQTLQLGAHAAQKVLVIIESSSN